MARQAQDAPPSGPRHGLRTGLTLLAVAAVMTTVVVVTRQDPTSAPPTSAGSGAPAASRGPAAAPAAPAAPAAGSPAGTAPAGIVGGSAPAIPPTGAGQEVDAALAWLQANAAPSARLVVPDELVEAVSARLADRTVLSADVPPSAGDLLLATGSAPEASPDGTQYGAVAGFAAPGSATARAWVVQVDDARRTGAAERAAVRRASAELAQNPGLDLTDTAEQRLAEGGLDARLLLVLTGLATTYQVGVDVPVDAAVVAAGAAHRTLVITSLDARQVTSGEASTEVVLQWLRSQDAALRPREPLRVGDAGLRVTYPLPSPPDLLTASAFATLPGAPS